MMKELKTKMGGGKKKQQLESDNEDGEWQYDAASDEHFEEEPNAQMDDGRLTLGDLFTSIGKGSGSNQEVINTNRLQK
jgi:hypothetical protein